MTTTNKITPSSKVAASVGVRKWALRVIVVLAVVISIAIIASLVHKHNAQKQLTASQSSSRSEVPLASAPLSSWSKLVIPANGKSERFPVPPGMRPMVSGSRLRVHSAYSDGHECVRASEGEGSETVCPNGIVTGVYVTNVANEPNMVSIAFEPL